MPLALLTLLLFASASQPQWQSLKPGVEYGVLTIVDKPSHGDGRLHIVRIDPAKAKLVMRAATADGRRSQTAAKWADSMGFAAVINAGMYETDMFTHTGRLRIGRHVNNSAWVKKYKSLFILDTKHGAKILDASRPSSDTTKATAVAQNLRLIAGPGRNVWAKGPKKWSEAALAMDRSGRILMLFCRTPLSMWRFNQILLGANLGITHAQHLEGGPEASLTIRSPKLNLDLGGSYETGFNENDRARGQWVLPNVIAVKAD